MDPLKGQRKTLRTLAGVGFNPAEAGILLEASEPVAVQDDVYAARRLFNLGLVDIGRVSPSWRRAVRRTALGDRLVVQRKRELVTLAAEAPKSTAPVGKAWVKWGDEYGETRTPAE